MLPNQPIPCNHCDYTVQKDGKSSLRRHHMRKHPDKGFNYTDKNAIAYYLLYGLVLHYEDHTCKEFTVETLARIRQTARVEELRLCEYCLENDKCTLLQNR